MAETPWRLKERGTKRPRQVMPILVGVRKTVGILRQAPRHLKQSLLFPFYHRHIAQKAGTMARRLADENHVDISHLLISNDPPSVSEYTALRGEVDDLGPRIVSLRAQLVELEDRLYRCTSALSPIRNLPQEVLGEIFHHILDAVPHEPVKRSTLLRLGDVSKMWREEAHNPSRWATVTVEFPNGRSSSAYKQLESHLKKARGCPRSITVQGDCPCRLSRHCLCYWRADSFATFLSGFSSLRSLTLHFTTIQCFRNFMESTKRSLQSWDTIQSLSLSIGSLTRGSDKRVVLKELAVFPLSLTSLSLSLPDYRSDIDISLPFLASTLGTLTCLDITCRRDTSEFLDALRHCQNLRVLQLNCGHSAGSRQGDIGDVVLPKLHFLEVIVSELPAASKILPRLVLPSLLDLRLLTSRKQHIWESLDQLKILSGTSSLRSLAIGNRTLQPFSLDAETLADVVSRISSLHHLSLDRINFNAHRFVETVRQRMLRGDPCDPPSHSVHRAYRPSHS